MSPVPAVARSLSPSSNQQRAVSSNRPSKTEPRLTPDVSNLVVKIVSPRKPGAPHIKTDEEVMNLHIWDFAGHELYYITHQVKPSDDEYRSLKQLNFIRKSIFSPSLCFICVLTRVII